jgi:nicotinate-nucleotide pyrophosphorylase (carboxylating)
MEHKPQFDIDSALPIIRSALQEDIGAGDFTSDATIPADKVAQAIIICKQAGTICGLHVAQLVFNQVDANIEFAAQRSDGDEVAANQIVATVSGRARNLVTAERVALNFLQRMSGIATLTRKACAEALEFNVKILDTRKTAPGLRLFDKYAVTAGGGTNHRFGLYDMVLIKENHVALAGGVTPAIEAVKKRLRTEGRLLRVEVEVETLEQLREALEIGVDYILLDNFTVAEVRSAVDIVKQSGKSTELEVSGNVTLASIREYARTGVQRISMGALTHSPSALDVSMRIAS